MDAVTGTIIMSICYLFGLGLIMLEAFMPGFGVAVISGIVLEIVAIYLTNMFYGTTWCLIAVFAVLAEVECASEGRLRNRV